jgi:tetratricopeptide (TPR) repeat protein
MTAIDTRAHHAPVDAGRVATTRPSSHRRRTLGLAGVALLVGLALGRFATYHSEEDAPPAPDAAAAPGDAVTTLEHAVAVDPSDARSWQSLGVAYVRRSIQTGDPSGYAAAEGAFDKADALDPGATATLLGRGLLALTLHQFSDALGLGTRAHTADPFDGDALAIMVDASVETGAYDAAADDLQQLLDLRPSLAAFSRVSYLRELHGDVTGAFAALGQAETAGSGSSYDQAAVIALEADLHFNHGDVDAAARVYQRALDVSPDVYSAQVGLARVAAAHGDVDGAIDALTDLTARYPLPSAVSLLGDLQQRAGRTAEAATTYDLVRDIYRLQAAAGAVTDLEAAVFEADHGDPATAVELATRAYAARPTVYGADAMAWARYRTGDAAGAVPFVNEALRLGTTDALLRYHAAVVFDAAGDHARAAAEIGQTFAINPWFSFLHADDARSLASRLGVVVP